MTDGVTIYQSEPDQAMERLAQLDSGRVLVAAVGGEPRAALPLKGGQAVSASTPRRPQGDGLRPPALSGRHVPDVRAGSYS